MCYDIHCSEVIYNPAIKVGILVRTISEDTIEGKVLGE